MSKRLQVVVDEREFNAFRRAARRAGMTVSEWVRQTLRSAERSADAGEPGRKLDAVRRAIQHDFPAPDIRQMLAEIELGYEYQRD
ncbi:MAG: antitoxin [Actinomycetota bacterium]